jgi:hypothetical protein
LATARSEVRPGTVKTRDAWLPVSLFAFLVAVVVAALVIAIVSSVA